MNKISTGEPSTLATYRKIALVLAGGNENNKAVKFIDNKIKDQDPDEEVIADERQMLYLLANLVFDESKGEDCEKTN